MSGVRDLVTRLEMPPGPPPVTVVTQLQSLPFGSLRWDDFERLCLRLARSDHEVEDARRYGIPGQDQYGIDLFARRAGTGGYTVYQCKKVERFGPADIGAAVDKFLDGPWAAQADRFVLCTSHSLASIQLADRLKTEKERLAGRRVALTPWDADELDILMKDHPELVDDFFGRPVVTAFCGPEAAAGLGQRLDGRELAEYRRRLHDLYAAVFTQLDPGLPVPPGVSDAAVDLRRRYVIPDVTTATEAPAISGTAGPGEKGGGQQPDAPLGSAPQDEVPGFQALARRSPGEAAYRLRRPLGTWLAGAQRCLLVGGTGSGKSAALRFVTLDLLDEDPQLADLASHWGGRIPVWVSFPYWTSLIAREPEGVSLPDCARRWLTAYGQAGLWPLVEKALDDDRLLLIVDGLDEWATENAARTAAHLLQVSVHAGGIPVLAAGRSHGIRRLELRGGRWNVAEIAELDARQQRQIARVWAQIRLARADGQSPPADDLTRLADEESNRFIEQVRAAVHLGQLAQNPMLLMLLLYLHLRNADLPRDRFDAYEKVIEHLIADHPATRRRAAFSNATSPLQPALARQALAYLAYRLQREHPGGDVEDTVAARYVENALGSAEQPGLGLPPETAAATAASILATAEEGFGLLVRTGAATVRFFHRAIQEHLAAVHITRLPTGEQCSLVAEFGTDPKWEPVILSLLWLAPRPSEVEALLSSLPEATVGPAGEQHDRIRAEVAFGPFDTTARWAQAAAEQAITAIEQGERLAHQGQLLDRVLAGIDNPRTSTLVADGIGRWVYDRAASRTAALAAIAAWPRAPETWHVLTVALHDSDNYAQRAAGDLIPKIYSGDQQVRELLLRAANSSQRATTRAAALDAITRGWPEGAAEELTARARQSVAVELVIAAIDAAVRRGIAADDDFRRLVSVVSGGGRYPFSAWVDTVPEILGRGWAGSEELRDMCLAGAARQWEHGKGIKKSIATALLSAAFPGDDRVAAWIAGELDHAQHPFLMAMHPLTWRNIAVNFRDHPVVVEAARRWIPGRQFHDSEVSLLALVDRTAQMRDILITRLADASFPHWEAASLLEGWGMQDTAVAEALHRFLNDHSPAQSATIAHLVPQIIEDPGQARAALLAMLSAPGLTRPDLVVNGLARLSELGDVTEIVAAAGPHISGGLHDPFAELIAGFPQHPRVRELAIAALDKHDAPVGAVAHAYGGDPEMRLFAARALTPVSPPLRARIITTLGRRPLTDAATTALLEKFDTERHGDAKVLAATGWARRIRHDQHAATRAADRLTSLIQATGLDHEERRRAAFAALLVLGRAETFPDLRERYGNAGPVRVSPDLLHRDLEFLHLIAEHWSTLRELLGNQMPSRLSTSGDAVTFWTAICTVAAAYPDIQPDVLRAIDTHPQIAASTQALRFTAVARAGTPALLNQLTRVIDAANGPSTSRGNLELALFAADTIARQFAGDPDTAAQLTARRPLTRWELGRVAALCRGWPDHPAIHDLYQPAPPDQPMWADRELRYALLPARQLIAELRRDIDEMIKTREDQTFLVSGPLSARLRRDPEAVCAFEDTLDASTDPVMKAAIPSALGIAGALTQRAADWCVAEIERQYVSDTTDLGFDVRTGTVRGVAITLADVLQGPAI